MSTFDFSGYSDNTDLGSVTNWSRLSGSSGDAIVNSDGIVDFVTTNTTGAAYGIELGTADHSFEVTFGNNNPDGLFFPCCIRLTDANNFIGARWRLGAVQLWKRVSGTLTQVSGDYTLASIATNDRLKVTASGNSISVYFNDTLVIGPSTVTDHNTVTKVGVVARSAANSNIITAAATAPDLPSAGLTITSVTPSSFDSGIAGIVIAGSGFGASQGSSTVDIGGQAQTVTAWTDTSITITSARGSNSMGAASLKVTVR